MATKDDVFTIREIAQSAFRAFASTDKVKYKTVFHNTTNEMENAKMFCGAFVDSSFFEFKFTKKRDAIDGFAPFEGVRDATKTMLMGGYLAFVKQNYPILKINSTRNRVFVSHCGIDYEITFVAKRGIAPEIA